MKVHLAHRHHGIHKPIKKAEVPGDFTDYATPAQDPSQEKPWPA